MIAVLSVPDASALAAFFAACASALAAALGARSSRRVEKSTKPNGGETLEQGGTMADALMRIEAQVEKHLTFAAEQFAEVAASLRAGAERMARIEATAAATREDVAGLRSALGTEAQRRAGVEARLVDHIEEHHRNEGDHR